MASQYSDHQISITDYNNEPCLCRLFGCFSKSGSKLESCFSSCIFIVGKCSHGVRLAHVITLKSVKYFIPVTVFFFGLFCYLCDHSWQSQFDHYLLITFILSSSKTRHDCSISWPGRNYTRVYLILIYHFFVVFAGGYFIY